MSTQLELDDQLDDLPWPGPTYKLIVAGSRSWTDYELMRAKLREFWQQVVPKDAAGIEIVSGAAPGADELGEKIAQMNGVPCKQFPANWDLFGRSAGYRRNEQMANYANGAIVFWDGESKGSLHMASLACAKKLDMWLVFPDGHHITDTPNQLSPPQV